MKTYYLDEINFEDIIKQLDDVDEWQIYINSGWGSTRKFNCLLTRLEEKKNEWAKITLRAIRIASWAFHLFYNYSGKKILESECDGAVHIDAINCDIANWVVRWDIIDKQRYLNHKPIEPYQFLTDKEKIKFRNWEDIYLSNERLKIIFNNFVNQ